MGFKRDYTTDGEVGTTGGGANKGARATKPETYLTRSSRKTTLLMHPKNVDPMATGTLIFKKTNNVHKMYWRFDGRAVD